MNRYEFEISIPPTEDLDLKRGKRRKIRTIVKGERETLAENKLMRAYPEAVIISCRPLGSLKDS